MDEDLKQRLSESAAGMIEWLERTGKDGEAFVREQAPLVAQEIVALQLWANAVFVLVSGIILVAMLPLAKKAWGFKSSCSIMSEENEGMAKAASVAIFGIGVGQFAITLSNSGYLFMEALVAPRVVILHELQQLL